MEPLSHSFARLQKNYAGTRVELINCAVAAEEAPQTIFRIDPAKASKPLPGWFHQIASFNRDHLSRFKKHIPELDDLIVEEQVPGIPLDRLLERNKIKQIDLFQIDTEGYDYHIMKMIDFSNFSLEVINFEYEHLTRAQVVEIEELLHSNGYNYILGGRDLTAFKGIKDF